MAQIHFFGTLIYISEAPYSKDNSVNSCDILICYPNLRDNIKNINQQVSS